MPWPPWARCSHCRSRRPLLRSTPSPTAVRPAPASTQPKPQGGWCADHRLGQLTPQQRIEGSNLTRLRAAQAELAPGFEAGSAWTGIDLLAAYQEELEKRRPDPMLAASYPALASTVPITAARVRQVNALLCVSATRATARAVTADAEAQRQQMAR